MPKNMLHISDDAPGELKETISVAQRLVDNIAKYKEKADAGTLTFDDLDELARLNQPIVDEFPRNPNQPPGYPPQTNNLDELEKLAESRMIESEKLLKEQGGPVMQVESIAELEKLSKLSPEALSQMVSDKAKEKKESEVPPEEKTSTNVPHDINVEQEYRKNLLKENLDIIQDLYHRAKTSLIDSQENWQDVLPYQKQLRINTKVFKSNEQPALDLLHDILTGDEEDEAFMDKKPEAALILATLSSQEYNELPFLLSLWEEDENSKLDVKYALKYTDNPFVSEWIELYLEEFPPLIAGDLVEVLTFHERVDQEKWKSLLKQERPELEHAICFTFINSGLTVSKNQLRYLLEDPESDGYEKSLYSALIQGDSNALLFSRKRLIEEPEKTSNLAIYLACSGSRDDLMLFKRLLSAPDVRAATVAAMGIMGLPECVEELIDLFDNNITSKEDWDKQYHISTALDLITGAKIAIPEPEIREGPEGKEHEVTVTVDWKGEWFSWWIENRHRFQKGLRYRRGATYSLESGIDEMECPQGCYWTRQYSYYELQIRSGKHIAPFYADWDVEKQLEAIQTWKDWWQEHQYDFSKDQWLYNGKMI